MVTSNILTTKTTSRSPIACSTRTQLSPGLLHRNINSKLVRHPQISALILYRGHVSELSGELACGGHLTIGAPQAITHELSSTKPWCRVLTFTQCHKRHNASRRRRRQWLATNPSFAAATTTPTTPTTLNNPRIMASLLSPPRLYASDR